MRTPLSRSAAVFGLAVAAVAGLTIASPPAFAEKPAVYQPFLAQYAVDGYDLVSYQQGSGAPVRGSANIAVNYNGVIYRFSSEANRDAFLANPNRYLPAYGGYCAWAVAQGYTAAGNPRFYRVVNGRLYLNYDRSVQTRWEQDIPGFITAANQNWPNVLR